MELERENLVQSKENYILNSELDYENVRAGQLQRKNDEMLAGVTVNKMIDTKGKDRLLADYERKIQDLERGQRDDYQERLQKVEIERLQTENQKLKVEVQSTKDLKPSNSSNSRSRIIVKNDSEQVKRDSAAKIVAIMFK